MDVDFFASPTKNQMDLTAVMMEMEMEELNNLSSSLQPPMLGGAVLSPEFFSAAAVTASSSSSSAAGMMMKYCPSARGELSFGGVSEGCCRRAAPSVAAMREMIFRMAAMQPIRIDPESVRPPKRRNVMISKDPQSVAARHRRERISERIRILQQIVPGGTKMDTASMLDEAIHYMKFLKSQVQSLERAATAAGGQVTATAVAGGGFSASGAGFLHGGYSCFDRDYEAVQDQVFLMSHLVSDVESK